MVRVCRPGGLLGVIDYHKSKQMNTMIDQQFFVETMSRGIFFGGKPVIVCNLLYDLDEHRQDIDCELVFDEHIDKSLSQSFRATILKT